MSRGMLSLIALLAVAWLGSMSVFVVNERELAIKFRLGEFVRADYAPGLYFKIPFINNVRFFDKRILTLEVDSERYLTQEKKNVIVDSFIKWRVSDVATYYLTMRGDEQQAAMRLAQVIKDGLRSEFGKRTMQEAISGERSEIMNIITSQMSEQAKQFGIEVVDVRIKRIELPAEVSSSVYHRMEAERSRVAKDLRSRGAEAAERIRADADRQRTVILAEAYRDAERIRGEGDGRAAEIYAKAFGRNPEFYALYRSLDAYRNTFSKSQDMLVVDPSAEFFQYFNNATGTRK
ncbi:protease modulator HflC [Sulfurivermis fontis]|uniref:protease modulator HflC n=1 Tax=Sulfurivermis fontis TaxID=1972068 RepID=UPI000FD75A3C|nr:protease modulator HflC [Sulfurivermis fontis]